MVFLATEEFKFLEFNTNVKINVVAVRYGSEVDWKGASYIEMVTFCVILYSIQ
jgi:hypothetical protein